MKYKSELHRSKLGKGHDPLAVREDYANYCKREGRTVTADSLKLAIRADKIARIAAKYATNNALPT